MIYCTEKNQPERIAVCKLLDFQGSVGLMVGDQRVLILHKDGTIERVPVKNPNLGLDLDSGGCVKLIN